MNYQQPGYTDWYTVHSDVTDPLFPQVLPSSTGPMPAFSTLPRQTRGERFAHWLGRVLTSIVNKIRQLLGLALFVVLLALAGRFLLVMFSLTHSLFAQWVFFITSPLLYPFNDFAPTLPYNGYHIDLSTLAGMVVYTLAVIIVRRFLRILIER